MSRTLLLDLDNTLLTNDFDTFLLRYIDELTRFVSPYVEPDKFIKNLLTSTHEMEENRRPDCTLEEVFESSFFPTLDIDSEKFREVAQAFYQQVFPSLQSSTQQRPEAVALVERALAQGDRVVIATNPLFPETAIHQRLEWANLPVEKYPFELVTTYETFHFSKPSPAYYAEILARLGWPDGPVITAGDDYERDILASKQMGLPAFWISEDGAGFSEAATAPNASGDLIDFSSWLEKTSAEELKPNYNLSSAMLAILRSTPATLDSFFRDLTERMRTYKVDPKEWCLDEILCHLRDVEQEVNLSRVQKVLQEENPFLPGIDTDRWAQERDYLSQNGMMAFNHFMNARLKLLDILENIHPDAWQRSFRHAIFGPTSLSELVSIIAQHDQLHVRQVQKILSTLASHH